MPREPDKDRAMRGKRRVRGVEEALRRLARRQQDVGTRAQLRQLGLSDDVIDRRLAGGRYAAVHRGVYKLSPGRMTAESRWMAAVLAAGEGAVLSHESAARLWKLITTKEDRVHVTAPAGRRDHRGVRVHEGRLRMRDIRRRDGIPVTSPERTLLDLAATLNPKQLDRAIRQAEYHRLTTLAALAAAVERHAARRGSRALRKALDQANLGNGITRDELEYRFRAFLRTHGLPTPRFNAPVEIEDGTRYEVDVLWNEQRLIVELDGGAAHRTADAFHADRARDRKLTAAGRRVVRITWRQLHAAAGELADDLHRLLDAK